MATSDKQLAEEIVHTASEAVSELIFNQAMENIRALQIAAHALDARASQVAALQFAGAALAGSSALTGQVMTMAALSAVFFVAGGLAAFVAVRSGNFNPPGIAPIWWKAALSQPLTLKDARAWAAGATQSAISQVHRENCRRALFLNVSLCLAAVGAAMIAFGAVSKAWPSLL